MPDNDKISAGIYLSGAFKGACRMAGGEVGGEPKTAFGSILEDSGGYRDLKEAEAAGYTFTGRQLATVKEAEGKVDLPPCSPSAISSDYRIPLPTNR